MGRGLSAESHALIQRVRDVLVVEQPTGVRRIGYALFGNEVDKHIKKLGRLLTRARKRGYIPWSWISDDTRPERIPFVVEDTQSLLATNRSCPSYDPWSTQPARVLVWSEKSVGGTLAPVLDRLLVRFQVHHGNTSTDWMRRTAVSTWEDPRELLIVYVGDHDPKGVRISDDDIPKRLAEYGANMRRVTIQRVGLLRADAVRLPVRNQFKADDKDVQWYRQHTGLDYGVELEAMPSTELRERVEHAIEQAITDRRAWNRVITASDVVRESWEAYVDLWQVPAIQGLGSE